MLRLTAISLLSFYTFVEGYSRSPENQPKTVFFPITVIDPKGHIVTGLDKNQFHLYEGSSERAVTAFFERDTTASIGIVLDLSGSMRRSISDAQSALHGFFVSDPHDEAFLYAASSEPHQIVSWTGDTAVLENHVSLAKAEGDTALYDTIAAALKTMQSAHSARRAMLIVSDGMDNHSRLKESELMQIVRQSDIRIFAIAVEGGSLFDKAALLADKTRGTARLQEITEASGGFTLLVRKPGDMQDAAEKIGQAIRYTYVLGFEPANEVPAGKWQPVRVKVNASRVKVYARCGYYTR